MNDDAPTTGAVGAVEALGGRPKGSSGGAAEGNDGELVKTVSSRFLPRASGSSGGAAEGNDGERYGVRHGNLVVTQRVTAGGYGDTRRGQTPPTSHAVTAEGEPDWEAPPFAAADAHVHGEPPWSFDWGRFYPGYPFPIPPDHRPLDDEVREARWSHRAALDPDWLDAVESRAAYCAGCARGIDPGETVWRECAGGRIGGTVFGPWHDRRPVVGSCCRPRVKDPRGHFDKVDAERYARWAVRPCEGCGRPTVMTGWGSYAWAVVACSDDCQAVAVNRRRAERNERRRLENAERRRAAAEYWATRSTAARTLPCPICGRDFPENYDIRKYCSNACRQKAYRARRKAASS